MTAVETKHDFDLTRHKFDSLKAFRISTQIPRFINNCRKNKKSGPLTTAELLNQKKLCIKREQKKVASSDRFDDNEKRLNLEKNDDIIYVCKGRLQGFYPIYLPQDLVLR